MGQKITGDFELDADGLRIHLEKYRDAISDFHDGDPTIDDVCEIASWSHATFAFLSLMEGRFGTDRTNDALRDACEDIEWSRE